jgi:hypothetical protein
MAINAVNVTEVTVNPVNVRYSLALDSLGSSRRGSFALQRAEKRENGTWIDDPAIDSKKTVPIPTTTAMNAAVDGVVALLPSLLAALGVTESISQYKLRITGQLLTGGVLDENIVIQFIDSTKSVRVKTIPSLMAFLAAHPTLIEPVLTAWDSLDTAINTANATEEWL